jgi:hypothetical protein
MSIDVRPGVAKALLRAGQPFSRAWPESRQKGSLNRYRGKGQQKVTAEHVHVHAGGRAVVGVVGAPGGGDSPKLKDQPPAKIAHAPRPPMRSADEASEPVPVARDAKMDGVDCAAESRRALPKGT